MGVAGFRVVGLCIDDSVANTCVSAAGKQLFSEVIPPVNRTGYANEHPDKEQDKDLSVMDTKVVIRQGELIMGVLPPPNRLTQMHIRRS